MQHKDIHCHVETVKIHGRILKNFLDKYEINPIHIGKTTATGWMEVCPCCHAYELGAEFTESWPFLCADSIMRTVHDFDYKTKTFNSRNYNFCNFIFSENALRGAVFCVKEEDINTEEIENLASFIAETTSDNEILSFSESVCKWGGGERVWGNLSRLNDSKTLARSLREWFLDIRNSESFEHSIEQGIKINGLGVSFASKHLRMLNPRKYAVLDEVLSTGLGFALNPKGYQLFMDHLNDFSRINEIHYDISTLESGIFYLIRQIVRAKP